MIKWVNGQAFTHYGNWECVQAGYWSGGSCDHSMPQESVRVLRDNFSGAIKSVLLMWPVTCAVHLSNRSINRNAWIGQSACFVECGNCIECTVDGWCTMSKIEQRLANEVASHWIQSYLKINSERGTFLKQNAQLELAF